MNPRSLVLGGVGLATTILLGACPRSISDPGYELTLTPQNANLFVDDARQFTATLKDHAGSPVPEPLTWSIDKGSVAQVDANGLVRAVAAGTATLQVSGHGQVASAVITVAVDSGQNLTVTPSSASVYVDGTQRFTAVVTNRSGDTLDVSLAWASDDPGIARVDQTGLVTGVATGAATIRATARGLRGSGSVTVSPRPSSAVLVGAGDVASCTSGGDEATALLLDGIAGTVFAAGDLAYENGAADDFANCYAPSWGRHKARTKPVPGNHEYFTFGATGYFDYFGSTAGDPSGGYYSYDLGAWHILALNSNLRVDPGSPQEQWIRQDLVNSKMKCALAYFHHPRFSSGADHGDDPTMQPLWQTLYDYGVDVVISAHDHIYERFAPQTPAGVLDRTQGIREFIVGTGGASRDQIGTTSRNSELRTAAAWGVLKLTLFADRYEWKFVPVSGQSFTDSGTGSCH